MVTPNLQGIGKVQCYHVPRKRKPRNTWGAILRSTMLVFRSGEVSLADDVWIEFSNRSKRTGIEK